MNSDQFVAQGRVFTQKFRSSSSRKVEESDIDPLSGWDLDDPGAGWPSPAKLFRDVCCEKSHSVCPRHWPTRPAFSTFVYSHWRKKGNYFVVWRKKAQHSPKKNLSSTLQLCIWFSAQAKYSMSMTDNISFSSLFLGRQKETFPEKVISVQLLSFCKHFL